MYPCGSYSARFVLTILLGLSRLVLTIVFTGLSRFVLTIVFTGLSRFEAVTLFGGMIFIAAVGLVIFCGLAAPGLDVATKAFFTAERVLINDFF
jgi:hypothetical protein